MGVKRLSTKWIERGRKQVKGADLREEESESEKHMEVNAPQSRLPVVRHREAYKGERRLVAHGE